MNEDKKTSRGMIMFIVGLLIIIGGLTYLVYFDEHEIVPLLNDTSNINNDFVQIVLLNPVGCPEEACNDFSVEGQKYADLLNIEFNRVAYPGDTQIPAIFLITKDEMSLITAIESKNQVGEYVCLVTKSARACEMAGLLQRVNETIEG